MATKTLEERLDEMKKREAKIVEDRKKLEAKVSEKKRKERTRRLIQTGAIIERASGEVFDTDEKREALLEAEKKFFKTLKAHTPDNSDSSEQASGEVFDTDEKREAIPDNSDSSNVITIDKARIENILGLEDWTSDDTEYLIEYLKQRGYNGLFASNFIKGERLKKSNKNPDDSLL